MPLLFALLAAGALWLGPGFLNTRGGGDSAFLLFRLHQLTTALEDGVFPVRWMPDAAFGLGYPFFNYYAALPYYLAAMFYLAGLSFAQALVLVQTLGFGLAAWGMYAWLNQAGYSRQAAWLGAAAYTFAPFHLVNVYVRGDSLSEFWAFAWYPLILLAALRLARRPAVRRALPLALAYAALLLTHNISALIFTPVLAAYVALLVIGNWVAAIGQSSKSQNPKPKAQTPNPKAQDPRPKAQNPNYQLPITNFRLPLAFTAYAAVAVVLGLALAAFFWLPALLEGGYGQLESVTQGYFNYAEHFRGLNLVQASPLFNYEISGEAGAATPFAMGLAQALLVLAGLGGLALGLARGRVALHDLFGVLGLAAATFMITPLSRPLWDTLPLLPFVQFPWRFLSVQAVFAALVTCRAVLPWEAGRRARRRGAALAGLGLSTALALAGLVSLRPDFIPIGDGDVTAQRLQLYEYFSGNIGTTIRHEYLPRWTTPRPYASDELLLRPPRAKALRGAAAGTRLEARADRQEWRIMVDSGRALVAVPLLYWPGWTAQVDGEEVEVAAAPGLGWAAFVVPQGEHTVTLQLRRTVVRGVAEAVSLIGWLLLALFGLLSLRRTSFTLYRLVWGSASALAVLALAGAAALLPNPQAALLRLSADFDQLAYFNSAPIRFAGGAALTGYDYSADRLARGQTLEVTSLWGGVADGPPARATLELVQPPAPPRQAETVFASAEFDLAAVAMTRLALPANMPPGVYLPRLRVAAGDEPQPALTSGGRARGAVYLRPVWVGDGGGADEAPETEEFGPALHLLGLSAAQTSLDTLDVQLVWQAVAEVPQNYALALRLNDASGAEWAALDTEPAYGLYPTGLWRPGEVVPDRLGLPLPLGTPPGDYALTVILYEAESLEPVGRAERPVTLAIAAPAAPADAARPLTDWLGLAEVEAPAALRQGDTLNLTAHWVTLARPPASLQARWSLTPQGGGPAVEITAPLAGTSAVADWPEDALVLGRAALPLPRDLPPGAYDLSLALVTSEGQVAARADGLAAITVLERERLAAPPPEAHTLEVNFGTALGLAGYTLEQEGRTLTITPYWQARAQPQGGYKYFIHVFDPASEAIVAQHDDFPQGGAYPTEQWAAGEVVPDPIEISLAGVPPGTYRVALGWYDPANPDNRLAAQDADGRPLDLDRVVLPDEVVVR